MKDKIQFLLLKFYVWLGIYSPDRMPMVKLAYLTLSKVPKDKWAIGNLVDANGNRCALGWMQEFYHKPKFINSINGDYEKIEVNKLYDDSNHYFNKNKDEQGNIVLVNDTTVNGYNEDNPKDRVVHLLEDMIKTGY